MFCVCELSESVQDYVPSDVPFVCFCQNILRQRVKTCAERVGDNIKGFDAQLGHLELPKNMNRGAGDSLYLKIEKLAHFHFRFVDRYEIHIQYC